MAIAGGVVNPEASPFDLALVAKGEALCMAIAGGVVDLEAILQRTSSSNDMIALQRLPAEFLKKRAQHSHSILSNSCLI